MVHVGLRKRGTVGKTGTRPAPARPAAAMVWIQCRLAQERPVLAQTPAGVGRGRGRVKRRGKEQRRGEMREEERLPGGEEEEGECG